MRMKIFTSFEELANEVQPGLFLCTTCNKACKSKGGLTRHISSKHGSTRDRSDDDMELVEDTWILTASSLVEIGKETAVKLSKNMCYPKPIRDEFVQDISREVAPENLIELLHSLQPICSLLTKSHAKVEKFFSEFYLHIVKHASTFFPTFSPKVATLFASSMAVNILNVSRKCNTEEERHGSSSLPKSEQLSGKEIAGLQYLGGYIFRNLHKKISNSGKWKTKEGQQILSVLEAAKQDKVPESDTLVTCLNRGGLWSISNAAQNMLRKAEFHFKHCSVQLGADHAPQFKRKKIVEMCMQDMEITSNFQNVLGESSLLIDAELAEDVFHSILDLYVRVRCYTYCKGIVDKYKSKGKLSKAKGLRKEIKKSSNQANQTVMS
ncbi:uncharacterized protein LOC135694127 [Rhopilema esculentum]|uniref:uncharacterized protein LOC135694127 n=1 Tax=Rhopilema esculentum TaxID=499914 RepID=UPI0031DA1C3B